MLPLSCALFHATLWLSEDFCCCLVLSSFFNCFIVYRFSESWLEKNWLISSYAHLNPDDPGHVLAFLVAELTSAEANGQRVHIHAHVPPTSIDCFPEWTKNYQLILERFRETIAEQFFGHNHVEKNLVWLDSTSQQPMATGWVAPSLTTWSHVNPAFRVYTIESTNFVSFLLRLLRKKIKKCGSGDQVEPERRTIFIYFFGSSSNYFSTFRTKRFF